MLYIGTSGWNYNHWRNIFYPQNLSCKDFLNFFSKHFKTVEINYSFYHLPKKGSYQNWYEQTPKDFLFSVKASRFITHIKRLKNVKTAWKTFLGNALQLKEKLGPILFQFPPSFKAKEENIRRLENFLKYITMVYASPSMLYALEFRHKSWFDKKIYDLLKKYNCALVNADSPRYPKSEEITANFIYIRMHGSKILFSSKYTRKELNDLSLKIKKWEKKVKHIYVYFNNDAYGYAIENAKTLQNLPIANSQ